ncbi:hypothetical protein [Legionella maioricensis]|uniref:Uncharacterized protein n=1 Tax=Legionella maioricensis TaxID=2896528 RepID=A0A9X2D1P3_9GAMM|nr:hypothetical protein [Legionella maioricensis]MCL9685000.1 hypothetical protein [Legionella maioricensis]MCL9688103.1 hypothetical protein [Legionella maioricensis]
MSIFLRAKYPKGQIINSPEQDKIISWEWFDIDFIPDNLFLPLKNLLHEKGKEFLLYLSSGI